MDSVVFCKTAASNNKQFESLYNMLEFLSSKILKISNGVLLITVSKALHSITVWGYYGLVMALHA